jgi:hypothetical protein
MSIWDLRRFFPSTIEDRTPEVAYDLGRWLTEEPRPTTFDSDWLVAAFAAAPGPTLSGKSFQRRSF